MVVFSDTKNPLNPSQIEEMEKYIGLVFPIQYKDHLLEHNGGGCIPNVFNFIENGQITSSNIDWFLAIYDGKANNIKNYIDIYKVEEKRLPVHILPIAHDPGGNLICISCKGSDEGSVYFWDHENEVDYTISGDEDYSNLHLIALSFKEFLDGLTEEEDDEN